MEKKMLKQELLETQIGERNQNYDKLDYISSQFVVGPPHVSIVSTRNMVIMPTQRNSSKQYQRDDKGHLGNLVLKWKMSPRRKPLVGPRIIFYMKSTCILFFGPFIK